MAQQTDAQLATDAGIIKNETLAGLNTALRIGTLLENVNDSKINLDKIDTANALNTAGKTIPGRDAVIAFIAAQIAALVNSSPAALDTLNELAAALGNDANFATTVTNALAGKQTSADNTLNTTSKSIVGAINELKANSDFNTPVQISYTTSIPFNKEFTDIADHILAANDVFIINVTGSVDNAGAQVKLTNNILYTPDLSAFHIDGIYDNSKTYSILTFYRKRGMYIVMIQNLS